MIRFELGNQICVCLSEKELSLQLNNSIHSAIPVNRIEYLILSTIAAFGSLNAPISQRKIEKKLSSQHHLMLPENGFKNAVASIRKKFRQLTKEVQTTDEEPRRDAKVSYRKHPPKGIFCALR